MHLREICVTEGYNDNLFDRLFIWLFSRKMAIALGKGTTQSGYDGFVDLSQQIMQGRNAAQQQALVSVVLKSLVPAPILTIIRTFFSPTQLVCELNAWFATILFEWLVGPCEVRAIEVMDKNGKPRSQRSEVYIKKCRYLEQSGCVGMCINMCKLPTQSFFTQDFGIPLTMTPNFEDLSCEMVFGQLPPPLETEAAYHQPCLIGQCITAAAAPACPKVRE
jgi:Beta-carotene isomerase D27-like, C-terminal